MGGRRLEHHRFRYIDEPMEDSRQDPDSERKTRSNTIVRLNQTFSKTWWKKTGADPDL